MQPTYHIRVHRLDAALADLRIAFADLPPGVQVRGRLMGPRCPGISTVEIAYHLRPLGAGVFQVLIPDPTFATPDRPYVYEGPAEFWHNEVRLGTLQMSISLQDPSSRRSSTAGGKL